MREWINGDTQLWDITEEHDSEDVNKAIKEQDTIGWEQFFRGRLSKEMGQIQDREYEILRSKDPMKLNVNKHTNSQDSFSHKRMFETYLDRN